MKIFQPLAILCAGVTSYKALKESDARPGQFVCIIGAAGGLGHLAVQYGKAMGFRVIAIDLGAELMDYCVSLGAEHFIDASRSNESIVDEINQYTDGGCHAVVVIAPHISAYTTGLMICRRRGTLVCVSLPKDESSFDVQQVVMKRITIRGTIVGTREDMREALDFASRGLVSCRITKQKLEDVNDVMEKMLHNQIHGRVVLEL
jgi:propanol-preferring alcohol dehydrogenase